MRDQRKVPGNFGFLENFPLVALGINYRKSIIGSVGHYLQLVLRCYYPHFPIEIQHLPACPRAALHSPRLQAHRKCF